MWPLSMLPKRHKATLRRAFQHLLRVKRWYIERFRSYGYDELVACFRTAGIERGDTVLLHSGFDPMSGLRGSVGDVTNALLEAIGPDGNLTMVSMAYHSSAYDYLKRIDHFDVRRTPSMMGLVSEFFRRRPTVLRSLQPAHPILACGPKAEWIVKDHELCEHSCGPGSPFEKLTELDAKAVFFNVPFANFTYFHYLEHLVHLQLPFALYTEEPIVVSVIDRDGQRKEVSTYAFAPEAISRRRFETFEREMLARDMIHEQRIGNTYVLVVRLRDAVECVREMSVNGIYFYDLEVPGVVGTTGAT